MGLPADRIRALRGPRNALDPVRPYGWFTEEEPDGNGGLAAVSTVLLTNRECPWTCLMCDLWQNTLESSVPIGAIPTQIRWALDRLAGNGAAPAARWIKLYNAGSFFDPQAIPPEDHAAIADLTSAFGRVIVEAHPALVGPPAVELRDLVTGELEVAMGLETIHPDVLPRLGKRMTLDLFERAAGYLAEHGIGLRAFVLLGLPEVSREESLEWALRSVRFALDAGARAVTLIPTRAGNGAMDELEKSGRFEKPALATLERALQAALGDAKRGATVLADTWDAGRLEACAACAPERLARVVRMNLTQAVPPPLACASCAPHA